MLRCEINTFTTVHMLGLKKCEKIHELDEEDSHSRSHHRKSRDDNLVEDVAYHQGGSNNHLLRIIDENNMYRKQLTVLEKAKMRMAVAAAQPSPASTLLSSLGRGRQ